MISLPIKASVINNVFGEYKWKGSVNYEGQTSEGGETVHPRLTSTHYRPLLHSAFPKGLPPQWYYSNRAFTSNKTKWTEYEISAFYPKGK